MSSSGSSSKDPAKDMSNGKSKNTSKDNHGSPKGSSSKGSSSQGSSSKGGSSKGGISEERLREKIKGLTPIPDGEGIRTRKNGKLYNKHVREGYFENNPARMTDGIHPRVIPEKYKIPLHIQEQMHYYNPRDPNDPRNKKKSSKK